MHLSVSWLLALLFFFTPLSVLADDKPSPWFPREASFWSGDMGKLILQREPRAREVNEFTYTLIDKGQNRLAKRVIAMSFKDRARFFDLYKKTDNPDPMLRLIMQAVGKDIDELKAQTKNDAPITAIWRELRRLKALTDETQKQVLANTLQTQVNDKFAKALQAGLVAASKGTDNQFAKVKKDITSLKIVSRVNRLRKFDGLVIIGANSPCSSGWETLSVFPITATRSAKLCGTRLLVDEALKEQGQ